MSNGSATDNALLLALGGVMRREIGADKLFAHVVDYLTQTLRADRATIYLFDDARRELVSVAAHLPEMNVIRVPVGEGVAGHVAATGEVVNVPYCEEDARFWDGIDDVTGYRTRSMLACPVFDDSGKIAGVVQVLNKEDGTFDGEDRCLLESLAAQLGTLLEETTLQRSSRYVEARSDEAATKEGPDLDETINQIVGRGEAMRDVVADVRRVAPLDATVLLRGESGTGKTLFARALHHNSERADGPFGAVDCTSFPQGLMESELFGHERGAFTGAHARRAGKVEASEGGTLFLDEIGDVPLDLQGKLLTLVQERTYCPVGSSRRRRADLRLVAATNRNLEELVRKGKFRQDLYYRLRVVEIELPPLRERGDEDLLQLVEYFVHRAARRHGRPVDGVRDDALEMLLEHDWPGNVRELKNCLESAVIFCDSEITPSTLSIPDRQATCKVRSLKGRWADQSGDARAPHPFADEPTFQELEARYIAHLLEEHGGNRSACARILDIGRNTLLRKIRSYGLED